MEASLKQKWIDALRSGEYEQGKQYLKSMDNKFCCLGVLCDIIDNKKWETFEKANSAKSFYPFTYEGYTGTLSNDMLKTTKINIVKMRFLMDMNDVHDKTFAEIADYIEANL
jgi:hypothetical protein